MDPSVVGKGCITTPVACGYFVPAGQAPFPVSHSTWASNGPPVFAAVVSAPHVGWVCSRFGGALPLGATLFE